MKTLFAVAGTIALLTSQSASAAFVIDDFNPSTVEAGVTRTVQTNNATFNNPALFPPDTGYSAFLNPNPTSSTANPGDSFIRVTYDLASALDLHSSGAFTGSPLVLDLFSAIGGGEVVNLAVTYTGNGSQQATVTRDVSSPGVFGIAGSEFGNGALASTVTQIELLFTSTTGATFRGTPTASITAVPEPAEIALLGMSMCLGLGGYWIRRRKSNLVVAA